MLRRLVASAAVTTALVLGTVTPAMADSPAPDETLDGLVKSCENLVDGAYWENTWRAHQSASHPWFTGKVYDSRKKLDVELTDQGVKADAILAVLVASKNATNLFTGPDLTGLYAPKGVDSNKKGEIKKYTICKIEKKPEPDPEPSETPKPEPSETPKPEPSETPKPEPSETPVPVPTEVPAGSGSSASPGAIVGLLAAATVALTALSVAVRRRFLHES